MIKHKKILKGFDFPKLVAAAKKKHPDLEKRIERFNSWRKWFLCHHHKDNLLIFDRELYCFKVFGCKSWWDENYTTESTNKYIGNYLYKDFPPIEKYFNGNE